MDPMAPMPVITIYNVPKQPALWDRVGVFYMTFCASWTFLVAVGMAFCWYNRHLPIIRIRGIGLAFLSLMCLHTYWIMAMITYPIGRTLPLVLAFDVQYFVMGSWFPLGIALFHYSNCRFLHVAKLQRQFTHPSLQKKKKEGCNGAKTSLLCRLRNMEYTKRTFMFIGVGVFVQACFTLGMWFACRKYHPTFGIPGTEIRGTTIPEQVKDLGRGWEWWPTVVWQFIWCWFVAPTMLYRAWNIRDTMGWRAQTIGCCLSSLHATPMFLIASYVPIFDKYVNTYFSPSQWIHFSTSMFEVFTVFVPCFMIVKHYFMTRKAIANNAKWETQSQTTTLRSSTTVQWKSSSVNLAEKGQTIDFLDEEMGDRLLTMGALEHVLHENPGPLQDFSAYRDFSGENIAFLTRTAAWQMSWPEQPTEDQHLVMFNSALAIYTDFISPRDAEFPLNLSSPDLKALEAIFEKPTRILCGEARINPSTPFDSELPMYSNQSPSASGDLTLRAQYTGEIPKQFLPTIFDKVQTHVKYLVLTNTWPKFVAEMQRRRSSDTGRSEDTSNSDETLESKASSRATTITNFIRTKLHGRSASQ